MGDRAHRRRKNRPRIRGKSISYGMMEVEVSKINLDGPRRHQTLPQNLLTRIKIIHSIFSEVYDITLEETIDNFMKDLNPEREVLVWERIASAYLEIVSKGNYDKEKKKDFFGVLLGLSMGPLRKDYIESLSLSKQELLDTIKAARNSVPEIPKEITSQ